MTSDMGEAFNAMRARRRDRKRKFGVACPQCRVTRPKTNASILLPGQTCKVDGYVDPRDKKVMT
jgi:hypothetical protein